VLEDFAGAVQGDCLEQLHARGAAALARDVAALHARWWSHPELSSAGWLPSLRVLERGADWFQARREQFLRRFGDQADSEMRRLLECAEVAQSRSNTRLADAPVTLLHADLHLDNVLFAGDPEGAVLLDWARVAQGPAAIDLAELLFAMTPLEEFDSTLAIYCGESRRHGVSGADEASLGHQLGGALLRKFIRETCGIAGWVPRSVREQAILESTLERIARAIAMWRTRDPELFRL
jgi:thiamine kinase-like enzyme